MDWNDITGIKVVPCTGSPFQPALKGLISFNFDRAEKRSQFYKLLTATRRRRLKFVLKFVPGIFLRSRVRGEVRITKGGSRLRSSVFFVQP